MLAYSIDRIYICLCHPVWLVVFDKIEPSMVTQTGGICFGAADNGVVYSDSGLFGTVILATLDLTGVLQLGLCKITANYMFAT